MIRGDKSARKTLTPKGAATREKLLTTAKQIFEQGNYHEASVSEICRRARLANGTFYQYFKDKEAVLLELAARLSEALRTKLEAALQMDGDLEARLLRDLSVFISFIRQNRALYQIFREIEFVNKRAHTQFYDRLTKLFAEFFAEAHRRGELRRVDGEVAAVAVIGVVHFLVLQWLILGPGDVPPEALQGAVDLILYGIDTGRPLRSRSSGPPAPSPRPAAVNELPLTRGQASRRKLLEAAEACFSRQGFYATSVADMTRRAGVSLGTFYLYFPSKTEILAELVRDINARLRRNARAAIAGLQDRREIEREGFRAFFRFVSQNMETYRIVREAEFVNPPVARWYFERLAQGYIKGLQAGMHRGEIRQTDAETLAYCLMGIGHFLGLRWAAWSKGNSMPKRVFDQTIDLILHGLKRPKP
jgi:AcrR family transcriptional regulator